MKTIEDVFKTKNTISVLINPEDTKNAKKHLGRFMDGKYILPNVFKIDVVPEEVSPACNAIEYILADIDFQIFYKII